jgi:hypothetical protein
LRVLATGRRWAAVHLLLIVLIVLVALLVLLTKRDVIITGCKNLLG